MAITVQTAKQNYNIDLDNNKFLNFAQDNDFNLLAQELGISASELQTIFQDVKFNDGDNLPLSQFIDKAVEDAPKDIAEVQKLLAKANKLDSELQAMKAKTEALKAQLAKLEAKATPIPAEIAEINQLTDQIKTIESLGTELKEAEARLKTAVDSKLLDSNQALKKEVQKFLAKAEETGTSEPGTPSSSTPAEPYKAPKAQNQPSDGGDNSANSAYGNSGKAFDAGTGYKALDSLVGNDGGILSAQADVMAEQSKRQQLMMLFAYFAKQAMSGDMGAMYQFMNFLTYVISRDKALQTVWMGTKMIELQETSRKATQAMLDTKVGESPADQIEWQKTVQKNKSENDVITMSQKLIGSMLEEFGQVSELMNNLRKNTLDMLGNQLRTNSTWRAS